MASKGYQRFSTRLLKFREDLELADIVIRGKELLKGQKSIFANINNAQHPALSKRQNNPNSRELVVKHLHTTMYIAFIKDLYEEATEYIMYVLEQSIKGGIKITRLMDSENINVNVDMILELSTKEEIIESIKQTVLYGLSRRSTIYLLKNINAKLGLNVKNELITDVFPYLECRHFFVHTDGVPSQEYRKKYPHIPVSGGKILLTDSFINNAYEKTNKLLMEIDKQVIANKLLPSSEVQ